MFIAHTIPYAVDALGLAAALALVITVVTKVFVSETNATSTAARSVAKAANLLWLPLLVIFVVAITVRFAFMNS